MDTIVRTINENLCISCGVCAANCPKDCITLERSGHMFLPAIEAEKCIQCGICRKVCPSNEMCRYDGKQNISEYLIGEYKEILCAEAKSSDVLKQSTSGGVVTQLVTELLNREEYQAAFLLNGYQYQHLLEVKRFQKNDDFSKTPKSRYLTVSHEQTVKYLIEHPEEKIILVATGCAVQGILNTIEFKHLNRENYFIIGLFCDKTMNYGVVDYFASHPVNKDRQLKDFYFRTKDAGGWPGNVRLVYSDESHEDLPNTERMKVKDYFMPERCLYCLDKLNLKCDIAVGDNYIQENADKKGVSSVVIRTDTGEYVWNMCKTLFHIRKDTAEQLVQSQHLKLKKQNYDFWCLKQEPDKSTDRKVKQNYKIALKKIEIGNSSNAYVKINQDVQVRKLKSKIRRMISKPIKRIIGK